MRLQVYEITFGGQAGSTLRGIRRLRGRCGPGHDNPGAELPDQAALPGLVLRITGLEVIDMHLVTSPAEG